MRIISDSEVQSRLKLEDLIQALESALIEYSRGTAKNILRELVESAKGTFRTMSALIEGEGVVGTKQGFLASEFQGSKADSMSSEITSLYDIHTGKLLALINSHYMNQLRTAAVGAISIKHLSNSSSANVGLLGSGLHAKSQLKACLAVRNIELVKVYSRSKENRESFCEKIEQDVQRTVKVQPVSTADEALSESDIVIEATTARSPVVLGKSLKEGAHVTSISGGRGRTRQIDDTTIKRASLFAVDSKDQMLKDLSGDLVEPIENGILTWDSIVEISDIISKKRAGRRSEKDITVFKTAGMALFDIAAAKCIFTS
ncbi:MAG: ornithine cyclodeaminase family protein [Nitrososphaerota archaeon]|nr:ornithine cyclodeaminase family protein [Nitrososphaerota archaeon]